MPQTSPPAANPTPPPAVKPGGAKPAPAPEKKKVDVVTRAKLWMAWWGVVVLGIGFVAFAMLAGWRARRMTRQRTGPSRPRDEHWYAKPLNPPIDPAEDRLP